MKYLFVFLFSKKTRRNWNRKTWELYTNFGFVILFYRNIIRISLHFNQVTYVLPDVSKNKLVLGIADRKQYFWEISLLILIKLPSIFWALRSYVLAIYRSNHMGKISQLLDFHIYLSPLFLCWWWPFEYAGASAVYNSSHTSVILKYLKTENFRTQKPRLNACCRQLSAKKIKLNNKAHFGGIHLR